MCAWMVGVAFSQPAVAQTQTGWNDRMRIGVSAGVQAATNIVAQDGDLFADQEDFPVTATASGVAMFVSGDTVVRLNPNLGLSLGVSYAQGRADADVVAETPHPFYFDQPRFISGTVSDVHHAELAVHAGLLHVVRLSARTDLAISGGVSYFHVTQDLVDRVFYSDAYPFDTATFEDASLASVTGSALGFHVAADLAWKLGTRWGIGILARYTRANVPFELDGEDAGTATVGGVQVGAGIRWMLPVRPRRPAAPPKPPGPGL